MEWIKSAWEAFKSDVKTRLCIAMGVSIFLICRSYIEQLPGGKNVFSVMAVPAFLICIIFWISIVLDLISKIVQEIREKLNDFKYKKYLLSLDGRKLEIVKKIYASPHYHCYLSQKDTDVMDLDIHGIIISSNQTILAARVWTDDFNDPPFLYVLVPQALKIIKKHEDKFIDKSAN